MFPMFHGKTHLNSEIAIVNLLEDRMRYVDMKLQKPQQFQTRLETDST